MIKNLDLDLKLVYASDKCQKNKLTLNPHHETQISKNITLSMLL